MCVSTGLPFTLEIYVQVCGRCIQGACRPCKIVHSIALAQLEVERSLYRDGKWRLYEWPVKYRVDRERMFFLLSTEFDRHDSRNTRYYKFLLNVALNKYTP